MRKYSGRSLSPDLLKEIKSISDRACRLYDNIEMEIHVVEAGENIQNISSGFIGSYGKIKAPHFIVVSFGYSESSSDLMRKLVGGAKRKDVSEIAEGKMDAEWAKIMDAVRLAPSAANSQPWRFVVSDDSAHVYIVKNEKILTKSLDTMNRIDAGIALGHLYTYAVLKQ